MFLRVRKMNFMNGIEGEAARTVVAIAEAGTLDAAAARLHITPSAVSQRVRALESQIGRPVLHRTRPVELTEAGDALVRYARQLDLLEADLETDLAVGTGGRPIPLTVVVNADSLHTWALRPLVDVADRVEIEVLREDQAHSLALLRRGQAAGAVTADADAVPGCSVERLGVMRYLAVCSPAYARRWFDGGVDPDTLGAAPMVAYDSKDDLQQQCLRRLTRAPLSPPAHRIPASAEFVEAIRLGLGWGMVPEIECEDELQRGRLVRLGGRALVDVPLHWQQWRRGSAALRALGDALRDAAAVLRR